jgi:trk system potassium uptake protein
MRLLLVASVVGELLRPFSVALVFPALLSAWDGEWGAARAFVLVAVFAYLVGSMAAWRFERPRVLFRAEALAVVAFAWVVIAVVAAIPYLFFGLGPVDALFESMSGLTTTGATILTDFSRPEFGRSFWLWRSMTQWFGGMGVIALFVVVLPRLGIAGRQLFFAEASGAPGEAVSPNIRNAAGKLWVLYVVLTGVCALWLMATGMSMFESVCHALTTLAAGGFSPNGESMAGYSSHSAEWVLSLFMFLAGASFPLQFKVYTGDRFGFFRDGEFCFYLGFTALCTFMCASVLVGDYPAESGLDAVRLAVFQVTSLMSSTGLASVDYNQWPDGARGILVLAMVIGGCAGSAAGGTKCVRHLLVTKHVFRELTKVLHPRAVLPVMYKGRRVPPDVMRAVFTLAFVFAGGYFTIGLSLVLIGHSPITAFSSALACLGNIGPGFEVVGPMGNYGAFSSATKLILLGAMWVGRLEIVTVLALLHPHVWRHLEFTRG